MAFGTETRTYNTMYVSTLQSQGRKVVDLVFYDHPLLFWLEKAQRSGSEDGGGDTILRPVTLRKNTAAQNFGRGATFDQVDLDLATMARYKWGQVGIPLTRYWQDEHENKGRERVINLVAYNIEETVKALRDKLSADIASTASPGNMELYPIPGYYVPDSPITGTVANINRANEADWRTQYTDSDAEGGAHTYLLDQMFKMISITIKDWGNTDYILAGSTAFPFYNDISLEQKEIVNKKMGDAAFAYLAYQGIPLVYDKDMPADAMYFLDSSSIEWVRDPDAYFTWTDWKELPNGLDKVAQLVVRCQLLFTKMKNQGVIFDIAA